jgi:flagellar hook protein FlgE
MIPALSYAISGLQASRRMIDRAAADVANVGSVGYRSPEHPERMGALQTTGNPLDLAVQGDGWFRVASFNGTAFGEVLYTRAGDFHRDASGHVVAADGRYVIGYALDATGRPTLTEVPIRVPDDATSISVGRDGIVSARDASGATTPLAAISLARFANVDGLETAGGGLYRASANSGVELVGVAGGGAFGELASGAVETSNVDVAEAIVGMLLGRHGLGASVAAFETADDLLDELVRLDR